MFNGIVQLTAPILRIEDSTDRTLRRISLKLPADLSGNDVRHGESIAINGVCLTVATIDGNMLSFDVIAETLQKTNIGQLHAGDLVNLERSLRAGDRIDGHFVQGHVDGTAIVKEVRSTGSDYRIRSEAPAHLAKFLIEKGSACLDGVSLTIASVQGNHFEVAIIPTTLSMTTLGRVKAGWPLNLEADVMTKTIVATLERMRIPIQD